MRTTINFNHKWAFTKQCDRVPEAMPADWDWVHLPHTWNAIDGQDGGNDYWRGTGWYAKAFDKIDLPVSEEYYLEFRGTNSSADCWLNGVHLGHHDGGYSAWRVRLTGELADRNLLVVAVDNSANDRIYPQMADFTFYGGIYRDVNLICVPESHFDLEYYGGPGIKVTPAIEGRDARVEVEVYTQNMQANHKLRYRITDADGGVIGEKTSLYTKESFTIPEVHLWHGRKDPYLYRVTVELMGQQGVLDRVSTPFGCRSFRVDPDEGFLLNGQSYPLRGVSRHQDRWGKGNALTMEDHRLDMELICELGANTIRLAHYQHDQYFYDLCDVYGQVVWAEIPFISKFMPEGVENTVSQMKELIVQNYNHPSIVVWGLSNEITIGGSDPAVVANHQQLNDLCHEWDPTRLTTIAAVSPCPMDDPYLQIPDVVSYNHYFGWYGGDTSMNGPWFDAFHAMHPGLPIGCSEYGCEGLDWHTSDPRQGDYTEEYQAYYHEELIKQLFTRKYLWATHVWNMFDFGADSRAEGGENGQNHKGLVTFDRSYKKDAFYAYKAWLSDEPFIHIAGKRYVDRVEEVTNVTVYSNLPQVTLLADGKIVDTRRADDRFFRFRVPNTGDVILTAMSGQIQDSARLRKVDTFNEDYRLKEAGAVLNWFDIEEPAGCCSLNDTLGTIMDAPGGMALAMELLAEFARPEEAADDGNMMAALFDGLTPDSPMMGMMRGFTILRMVNMAGLKVTKEQLLEMNKKLNGLHK